MPKHIVVYIFAAMILIGPLIFSRIYHNVFNHSLECNEFVYKSAIDQSSLLVLRVVKGGVGNNYHYVKIGNKKLKLVFEGHVGLIGGIPYLISKPANSAECTFHLAGEQQLKESARQSISYSLLDLKTYVNHRRNRTGMITAGIFLLLALSAQKGHMNNFLTYDASQR